eukprot:COSAG02_NODE_4836_length_4923_cov_5.490257_2_plen_446_part_00
MRASTAVICEHVDDVKIVRLHTGDDVGGAFQSLQETLKIVLSNAQIISQFPATMEFSCPTCESLTAMMKILPAVNVDVLSVVSFDCMSDIDLYSRFCFVVISPVILILIVQLRARLVGGSSREQVRVQQEEAGPAVDDDAVSRHDRLKDANQLSMLIIFLVYPTLSSTIFTMFACRDLDMDQSYHVYDTGIDCNSSTYKAFRAVAVLLLLAMPVGIPVFFFFLLYKNREALMAAEDDENGLSFDVFKKTVAVIEPESNIPEAFLEELYRTIDSDSSGEITLQELVQHALREGRKQGSVLSPDGYAQDDSAEEVRTASAGTDVSDGKEWWRGGPDEFKFLVKAFEPDYYCAHQFFSTLLFASILNRACVANRVRVSELLGALLLHYCAACTILPLASMLCIAEKVPAVRRAGVHRTGLEFTTLRWFSDLIFLLRTAVPHNVSYTRN